MGVTKEEREKQKQERLGMEKYNNIGELMKCIEYNRADSIIIEFQDKYKGKVCSTWDRFIKGQISNPNFTKKYIGLENKNFQGYTMKIIEYNGCKDIVVEFNDSIKTKVHSTFFNFEHGLIKNYKFRVGETKLSQDGFIMVIVDYKNALDITIEFNDEFQTRIHTNYDRFKEGNILNPSYKRVCGVGINNGKYQIVKNNKRIKEYEAWRDMLRRCYDENKKKELPTYKDATCCDEWLIFENFYEWIHSQENFDKWINGNRWAVDKDIIVKGNKLYSPTTCCLVPNEINTLFIKSDASRGKYPIGVYYFTRDNYYIAQCCIHGRHGERIGAYSNPDDAFIAYKNFKEKLIKDTANVYYQNKNITKKCYDAMMKYEVEITD